MNGLDLGNSLYWVAERRLAPDFPPIEHALTEPDGLLAIGGDLAPERLLDAYRRGIFPWYSDGQPILWWSPDPRSVLAPAEVHVSRSLRRSIRRGRFEITCDRAFARVIDACARPRARDHGTWITPDMRRAYVELHERGHAHSVEAWRDGVLCGGLYGIALGRVFFGESMFAAETDASKVAFVALCRRLEAAAFELIDCQVHNPHLASLGAHTIPRAEFAAALARLVDAEPADDPWAADLLAQ